MKVYIEVNTSFIGFHRWPTAPQEVIYLRDLHRHVFHVTACIKAKGLDRQFEFHLLRDWFDTRGLMNLKATLISNPAMSCEHMAHWLLIHARENNIPLSLVRVSEDGENAGVVEWEEDNA